MTTQFSAVVVGTGRMAPGIAAALASAGEQTAVTGRSQERAQHAAALAGSGVQARPLEAATFTTARLVVETVTEEPAVKSGVYAMIEPWLDDGALLTTNTSGLSIAGLARGLRRPGAFAGLHFLYPADVTPIVEIIAGEATAESTVRSLRELADRMGKSPIVAHRDVPGFVWNRLQLALLREALWLVDQGVTDIATVDAAVSDGLAPRWLAAGPFATVDLGGAKTWSLVAAEVFPHLASGAALAAVLQGHGENGTTFYDWAAEDLADLARLRTEGIQAAATVSQSRRRITPR
jgi:3-hydroxybutyryl-CoA dehydrogenase